MFTFILTFADYIAELLSIHSYLLRHLTLRLLNKPLYYSNITVVRYLYGADALQPYITLGKMYAVEIQSPTPINMDKATFCISNSLFFLRVL